MTTVNRGILDPLVRTWRGPWRPRILRLFATWLAFVVIAALMGLAPDAFQTAVVLLSAAVVVWWVVDHWTASHVFLWPLTDPTDRGARRGADLGVESLALRLAYADRRAESRPELTRQLHDQLSTIIRERLHAKHGITIEDEPRWAEGVMPAELWDFVTGLPDPDLYSPAQLDHVLRRIEQW